MVKILTPVDFDNGLSKSAVEVRQPLNANTTFYVNTSTGNDSDDGSSGSPFATWAKALSVLKQIDANGYEVTVDITGTITETITLEAPLVGFTKLILSGNSATVNVSTSDGIRVYGTCGTMVDIKGFTISAPNYGIAARDKAMVHIEEGMNFGACGPSHVLSAYASIVRLNQNYTISGNSASHILAAECSILWDVASTVTASGALNFSTAFVQSTRNSSILATGTIFINKELITGRTYVANTGGVIYTLGGGSDYFPGDIPGTTSTNGVYV